MLTIATVSSNIPDREDEKDYYSSNQRRHKRKKDGLTQVDAAALCGVGTRFLSDLENGKQSVHFMKVLKVLHGLGLVIEVGERGHDE